jgi:hypothetical protein
MLLHAVLAGVRRHDDWSRQAVQGISREGAIFGEHDLLPHRAEHLRAEGFVGINQIYAALLAGGRDTTA